MSRNAQNLTAAAESELIAVMIFATAAKQPFSRW
jgi:hypothetical protein